MSNQNEIDVDSDMFCQTIKCECHTAGLILFAVGFRVVSFLISLKVLLTMPICW